ncbi:hypothetical protein BC937DRAFT_94098 [Endogone sp. FLAS-F59071]|nr:hypothetical protein BC937DRAFT_94098 [Endogone sp. FLAS-F59071]|eukprot:RUS14260.1 hypothetical protein BC937DRAFT_94098 [Endogone sp. FLAS-F59071]
MEVTVAEESESDFVANQFLGDELSDVDDLVRGFLDPRFHGAVVGLLGGGLLRSCLKLYILCLCSFKSRPSFSRSLCELGTQRSVLGFEGGKSFSGPR